MGNEEIEEFLREKLAGALPPVEKRKELREAFGISQRELARRLGVSYAAMHSWESGRNNPTGEGRGKYLTFLRSAERVLKETEGGTDANSSKE